MNDDAIKSHIEETERYYELRAGEYEGLYYRSSERRDELQAVEAFLAGILRDRHVLEIAVGTGYWTEIVARSAASIVAIDRSPAMLVEAGRKAYPRHNVRLEIGDAYVLADVEGDFEAAMVNFWLSHVPRARIATFLDGLHQRLGGGALVFIADNVNVPGEGGELVEVPGCEDTFKLRELADGSRHRVIKNYLERDELEKLFARHDGFEYHCGIYYWWLRYNVRL